MRIEDTKPDTLDKVIEVVVTFVAAVTLATMFMLAVWLSASFILWDFKMFPAYLFYRVGVVFGVIIWVFFALDKDKGLTSTWR